MGGLIMEKEFVPYEIALELKRLGFDEPCLKYRWNDETESYWMNIASEPNRWHFQEFWVGEEDSNVFTVSIPTYSQAFRWFRENHRIHVEINLINLTISNVWYFEVLNLRGKLNGYIETDDVYFDSFESAELAGLEKLIEILSKTLQFHDK
jgi:hypothetical protein